MYAVRHFPACTLCQRYHMTSSAWRSDDGHKLGGSWSCSSLQLYMHVRTKLSFHVLSCHACLPACFVTFLFYSAESIKALWIAWKHGAPSVHRHRWQRMNLLQQTRLPASSRFWTVPPVTKDFAAAAIGRTPEDPDTNC